MRSEGSEESTDLWGLGGLHVRCVGEGLWVPGECSLDKDEKRQLKGVSVNLRLL